MKIGPDKMPIAFFLIEKELFGSIPFEDITEVIIHGSGLEEQKLKKKDWGDYRIRIYFNSERKPPKWQGFFKDAVAPDADILKKKAEFASFICFIECKENIFVIAGGRGSSVLQGFVVYNFGMEILVRLIDRNSKVIKSLRDRGVTGTILGESKFFRGDQRLSDEDQFGKIYKEVRADLDKGVLKDVFDFHATELRRRKAGCQARSSFQLNKSIDFKKMLAVCDALNKILLREPRFSLNKVVEISNRGELNKKLIGDLNEAMIKDFYDACLANDVPDYDFCHKEFEEYYSASAVKVSLERKHLSYDEPPNLGELIRDVNDEGRLLLNDVSLFKYSFLDLVIQTFDEDDERLTSGTVMDHLHGEVRHEGKTYFRLDGRWYRVDADFIRDLNQQCKDVLADYLDGRFRIAPFTQKREGDFNASLIGEEGFLVLDAITNENIEFCDLLKLDGNYIYVIHVKRGFSNSIRELASQAVISARTLSNDRVDSYGFIKGIERSAKSGKSSQSLVRKKIATQSFPADGLHTLFESKPPANICFCLAILDTGNSARSLQVNFADFNSNIAKYSIVALKREIVGMGFGFKIIELSKT